MSEAMTPISELKRLAEAVTPEKMNGLYDYLVSVSPQAILSLIARLERAEAALKVIETPSRGSELKDTDADARQYWSGQCVRLQSIARAALESP
jgi:hypothetical protein